MTTIGDTLRRERLKRNLDLGKIAEDLKISVRFLQAIETEDFNKLPGGVFTKSFVRQYANYLGLNAEELAAEVQRAVEPEITTPEFSDKPKPDVPGIPMGAPDSWQSVREHRASLPPWLKSGALLVALMLICSGVYWWWGKSHRSPAVAEIPPPTRVSTPAAPPAVPVAKPAENPPAVAIPAAKSEISQAAPDHSTAPPTVAAIPDASAHPATPAALTSTVPSNAPNPNASVRVGIAADEEVWISAYVNGKYKFSGTLQPHESRNIDVDGELRLRLGNAGGASVTLNGKPVGNIGPKGQVRDVQFTSGGFQIVSPPKSLEPLDRL